MVWDLERELPVRVLRAARRRVDAVAFSHDGRWLITAGERELRVFDDRGAQVRALALPPVEARLVGGRATGTVHAVAFTPGDRHVVVAGDDGLVRQFDAGGHQVQVWEHPASILALAVYADGLVTGSAAGRVSSWRWDGRPLWRSDHDGSVAHVAVSTDGGLVATAAADCTVRLWDRTGTATAESPLARRSVGVAFPADGTGLLTATQVGALEVWEPATGEARDDRPVRGRPGE
ncbi:WD40 repeat domain-containing protein [Geodermatophilus maliterrae]|uniref:WD40 repeat domain-containing protein n=1 Tax=Geodermatophilus maliterrae TaxID=3162531 RepID=A0ABV3XDH9_9ACTN